MVKQNKALFGWMAFSTWMLWPYPAAPQQRPPVTAPLQEGPVTLAKGSIMPALVPFQFWNGLMVVDAYVNGKDRESFVIDTGLNADAIRPEDGTRLQLADLKRPVRVDTLQTTSEAQEVRIPSLRMGTMTVENMPAASIDIAALLSNTPHPDAPPGWLGFPFLSAFQVTIDFSSHILALNPPNTRLPVVKGTVVVPISLRDGRIWANVTAPGAGTFSALVNTGAVGTLLPGAIADKLKLKSDNSSVIHVNGKDGKAFSATAPRLRLGKAELKDVPVVFLAKDVPSGFDRSLGVLGMDFLSHFKVTISYAQKKMALIPLPPTTG
ncbi:MAG TPA: aspartyl protease family protein [Chthonomonadaceae bacterium]|nr:aspartyl protease family protein [Chthonomonadaceae bacterium]